MLVAVEHECAVTSDVTNLLVVDDVVRDRSRVRAIAEQDLGWHFAVVDDASAALDLLKQQPIQVVVTAAAPRGRPALELVQAVREQYPDLPLVVLTGDGEEQAALRALQAGAASYVPRDMLENDLGETLSRVVSAAQTQRRRRQLTNFLKFTKVEYELDNDPAMISPLVATLQEQIVAMGVCDSTQMLRLGIALEEALLNGIHHGNLEVSSELRQDEGERAFYTAIQQRRLLAPYRDRRLRVEARIARDQASILIRDEGPGFDIATLPDPTDAENLTRVGGRGILLMKTFMDEVSYNERGNEVTLTKRRPQSP